MLNALVSGGAGIAGSVFLYKLLGDLLKQTIPREVNRLIASQLDAGKLSEQRHAETLRAVLALERYVIRQEIRYRAKKQFQDAPPRRRTTARRAKTRLKNPPPKK